MIRSAEPREALNFEPVNIQAESRALHRSHQGFPGAGRPAPVRRPLLRQPGGEARVGPLAAAQGSGARRRPGVSGIGSYLDADEDAPKYHDDTLDDVLENAIVALLLDDPSTPQVDIAEKVGKSLPTVKRAMKRLSEAARFRRWASGRRSVLVSIY